MLSLAAIIIAAFALMRVWQIYSRDKMKRELKQREITRRLKELAEKKSQSNKSVRKESRERDD